ncbi:F-box protein At1g78280-like [Nematostella vectensis]|uniref:F-box protein At1g78280-like n=1 Tax=Nematostella vectensis TaxID=45351 RepID=UPI002076F6FC|nr:F-box protein At1g78280-like [Nematostella vectensis]
MVASKRSKTKRVNKDNENITKSVDKPEDFKNNSILFKASIVIALITVASMGFVSLNLRTHQDTRSNGSQELTNLKNDIQDEEKREGSDDIWTIDRRRNLSLEEFIQRYDGKRPVLITDILPSWKAANWSKEFFAKNYGDQKMFMKAVQGTMNQAESLAVNAKLFAEHAHEGKPWLWTYVEDELFIQTHPELKDHLQNPIYLKEDFFQFFPKDVRPWNAMLLWGTAYSRSSLHIDPYNWTGTNALFSGKKMWKMYPPGQDQYLYIYSNRRCNFPLDCFKYNSPVDAFAPDLEKFPLFSKAKALSFTQNAGELLIIPTGWFHQAFNPEETIAVSSQIMNSQNYKICLEEIFKAGEVDLRKIPEGFANLSPVDQVVTVTRLIPINVIRKGRQLTENLLKQLKK